jgi:cell division septation protein DedD
MKIGKGFLIMLLTIPLFVACGNNKSMSSDTNKDRSYRSYIPDQMNQNQRIYTQEIKRSQRNLKWQKASEAREILATSSYQKSIAKGKTNQSKTTVNYKAGGNEYDLSSQVSNSGNYQSNVNETDLNIQGTFETDEKPVITEINLTPSNSLRSNATDLTENTITVTPVSVTKTQKSRTPIAYTPASESNTFISYSGDKPESYLRDLSNMKKFSVVVGSYKSLDSAYVRVLDLKKMNFMPVIVKNDNGMFRVVTGTFPKRSDADFHKLEINLEAIESWMWIK